MRHIPGQHQLVLPGTLQVVLQISAGERARLLLANDFLAALGLELCKLLGEIRVWREDGGAAWSLVNDVDEGCVGGAVFL